MGAPAGWPDSGTGLPDGAAREDAAQAVAGLYEAHAVGLIRLAVIMLGDRAAAEDVVQEAFCGLYRRWGQLDEAGQGPELRARRHPERVPVGAAAADPGPAARPPGAGRGGRGLGGAGRAARRGASAGPPRAAAAAGRQREALVLRFYLDRPSRRSRRPWASAAARSSPPRPAGWPRWAGCSRRRADDEPSDEHRSAAPRRDPGRRGHGGRPAARRRCGSPGTRRAKCCGVGGCRRRWLRTLTPLAAAAAVAAVVIASLTLTRSVPRRRAAGRRARPGPRRCSSVPPTTWPSPARHADPGGDPGHGHRGGRWPP